MSKTYYTQDGWRLAAVEDPRNPSFVYAEVDFRNGDKLICHQSQYEHLDELDDPSVFDSFANAKDYVTVYKVIDHRRGA